MKPETKAGIYITVSIHLAVIIVFMLAFVHPSLVKNASFEIDFSKQDEKEMLEEKLLKEKALNEHLNRMLSEAGIPQEAIHNVAVDKGALKDDRNTDTRQFYKDIERLSREMADGYDYDVSAPSVDDGPETQESEDEPVDSHEIKNYLGPAVVIYYVQGRKATYLSVPAYKCFNSGEVTIGVTVDNSGKVIGTMIVDSMSSDDPCLRECAEKAARKSRFTKDAAAPQTQIGSIIYQFLAQ